jgi:hypothetical protein
MSVAETTGTEIARKLLQDGAGAILQQARIDIQNSALVKLS